MTRRHDRPHHQIVVWLMPGTEPWVAVKTAKGTFRQPGTTSLLELLELLGVHSELKRSTSSELWVRVPLREL